MSHIYIIQSTLNQNFFWSGIVLARGHLLIGNSDIVFALAKRIELILGLTVGLLLKYFMFLERLLSGNEYCHFIFGVWDFCQFRFEVINGSFL